MRHTALWVALIVGGGSIGLAQGGAQAPAGGRQGGEGRTVILEQAPKDRSIAIPKDKLAQHLKDMDAKKLQTLRMIEGGKYTVNIRHFEEQAEVNFMEDVAKTEVKFEIPAAPPFPAMAPCARRKTSPMQSRSISAGTGLTAGLLQRLVRSGK